MRLVFAGTPNFAERALARLVHARFDVALVLTQPDRPAGRGLHAVPSAVKRFAQAQGLTLFQPPSLKDAGAIDRIREAAADVLVVAAYGLLLPKAALAAARLGAVNIHASLLPRWRGAAPIQRALLAGDRQTGISIMQMDEGLDTGPLLWQHALDITEDEDAGTLHDRLAELGAEMIVAALPRLREGSLCGVSQPTEGVTYAPKIDKRETLIDWSLPAGHIERMVRAFRPSPGALTGFAGEPIKIWRARPVDADLAPGELLAHEEKLITGCGQRALAIEELQRAGGKRITAAEFLRGRRVSPGARFDLPDALKQ